MNSNTLKTVAIGAVTIAAGMLLGRFLVKKFNLGRNSAPATS